MAEMATKDFSIKELSCPCCGAYAMQKPFLDKLQELRDLYSRPMIITSGYRCERHNAAVKGEKDSQHLYGNAVDIHCIDSAERFLLVRLAYQVGFRGFGTDAAFLHIDLRQGLERMWVYPQR